MKKSARGTSPRKSKRRATNSEPQPLVIGGTRVEPGTVTSVEIALPRLYTRSELTMPVRVVHGANPGPRLLVCAAIHGDELNGIDIIRRVLQLRGLTKLQGTLIAVPVINVYGLINGTRYLPDRRDLNRSFPGSKQGSLTSRLARLVLGELGSNATHVIDLHTGAEHRPNLPHVRANLDHTECARMARAFGAPVILDAGFREGSFRKSLIRKGVASIVYETGEALRLDESGIRIGFRGVVSVMRELGMLPKRPGSNARKPFLATGSSWVRAPMSGVFRSRCRLGDAVTRTEPLGSISDPLGDQEVEVNAGTAGVIIGRSNQALVYQGDALLHVARFRVPRRVSSGVQSALED